MAKRRCSGVSSDRALSPCEPTLVAVTKPAPLLRSSGDFASQPATPVVDPKPKSESGFGLHLTASSAISSASWWLILFRLRKGFANRQSLAVGKRAHAARPDPADEATTKPDGENNEKLELFDYKEMIEESADL